MSYSDDARSSVRAALACFAAALAFLLITHWPFLRLPYHWDELGQFIPAAHDLLVYGALVPRSTLPNVHPPLLMLYLAGVWKLFGFTIPVTRVAMLVVSAATIAAAQLLARRLADARAAWTAAVFLAISPPFVAQGMLAQLDLPATLWTLLALYWFLGGRWWLCGIAATALALTKETGLIVPMVLATFSLRKCLVGRPPWAAAGPLAGSLARRKVWTKAGQGAGRGPGGPPHQALILLVMPFLAVACWLLFLHSVTGYWLGNPQFAEYNVAEPLNPVRILLVFARRFFQLCIADFHWIATAVLILGVVRYGALRERHWRLAGGVVLAYLIFHSVLGGAVLLRYLLPALALFYVATAAALKSVSPRIRIPALILFVAGLAVSNWWNPRYRFASYEDNLAVTDFIQLQLTAATWLSEHTPERTVTTAWPLTDALSNPLLGYVSRPMRVDPVENFQPEAWQKVGPSGVEVVAFYSRTWDRPPGWQDWPPVARLLQKYFNYARQLPREELIQRFHLRSVARWERGGQWMEILLH